MTHVHMLCISVGKMTLPLLQRLGNVAEQRTRVQRTLPSIKCFAPLGWPNGPPFFCSSPQMRPEPIFLSATGGTCLRRWGWALNDYAPAVPGETSPTHTPVAQHSKRLNTLTHQLHIATRDRDFARRYVVTLEVQALTTSMQIPLVRTMAVHVPYLSPQQTPAVTCAINKLVHSMPVSKARR